MSIQQPPPSRSRRRASPAPSGRRETVEDWQRDWRYDVKDSIDRLAETQRDMVLLLKDHGDRIKALETAPQERQARINATSARNSTYIMLGAFISSVIAYVLQHGSFHP